MVKQSIAINFMPGRVQPYLKASQGDTGERAFEIYCYTEEEPYVIPSNATVLINGNKPGNFPFVLSCDFEGNKVTFDCTATMTDVCGQVVCELAVMAAGGLVMSANFILYVERQVIDTSTIPSSDYQGMIDILQEIQDATGETKADADRAEEAADRAEEAMANLKVNSKNDDGIVPKGNGQNWKIYATNGSGVPSWNEGDSYRLRGITEIPANADLNDYKAVGNYYVNSSANAQTILNAPIKTTYKLRVEMHHQNAAFVRQTLLSANDNRIFVRVFPPGGGATWSEWQDITQGATYAAGTALELSGNTFNVQLANNQTQATAAQKALDAVQANPNVDDTFAADVKRLSRVKTLTGTVDFDAITARGEYAFTGATATAASNCPVTVGGRLTVERTGNEATDRYARQICQAHNSTDIWERYTTTTGASWSAWKNIAKDTTYSPGTALALSGTTFNVQMLNAFTQATAGEKALDAAAGKAMNDRLKVVEGYFDTAARTVGAGAGGAGGFKTIAYNAATLEAGGNFIMVNTSNTSTDSLSTAFNNEVGSRLWACMSYAPQNSLKYQIAILISSTVKAMAIRNMNWWNNTWSPWYVMTDYLQQYNAKLNTTYVGGSGQYVGVYKNTASKIAAVEFDATFKSTYSSENVAIIATGLPKPANPSGGFVTLARGTAQYTPRVNVDENGRLQPWYCGNVNGQWTGSFMYFYRD